MGAGGLSREAAFTLVGPIPAGTWTFVGDGIIIEPVDVTFELIWRKATEDVILATWMKHFEPWGDGNFDAVPWDDTAEVDEVPASAGDRLVLRYGAMNAMTFDMAYIPNGEGAQTNGRIPYLLLPQ